VTAKLQMCRLAREGWFRQGPAPSIAVCQKPRYGVGKKVGTAEWRSSQRRRSRRL
jgi:hypothetical protein